LKIYRVLFSFKPSDSRRSLYDRGLENWVWFLLIFSVMVFESNYVHNEVKECLGVKSTLKTQKRAHNLGIDGLCEKLNLLSVVLIKMHFFWYLTPC
jgi:hypothetical protein